MPALTDLEKFYFLTENSNQTGQTQQTQTATSTPTPVFTFPSFSNNKMSLIINGIEILLLLLILYEVMK
jgi:hypothetical protein